MAYDLSSHYLLLNPDYGARHRFHFMELGLNLIRKWLLIPMMFVPLFHKWACLAGHYCSSQGSELGMIDDYFLLVACIASSCTMKANK